VNGAPLVIGVGNDAFSDDAAGLRAARLVRAMLWPQVRMIECGGAAAELLEAWRGEAAVVVLDAMSSGASAGSVRRLDVADGPLPAELFRGSTHGLGLVEAVELARAMKELPADLAVFGIEGADFGPGKRLTYPVECGVRDAALRVTEFVLERWGVAPPGAGSAA